MTLRKFRTSPTLTTKLSDNDKKLLEILNKVVVDFAQIYKRQLEDGFYPKGVSRIELEVAAAKNPLILSPYTQVYWRNGRLEAIPLHLKYADQLRPLAARIEEAAKLSSNKSFAYYLQKRAESLITGDQREAAIAALNLKHPRIAFSIGVFERYLDKVLFIKRAYQAFTGVVDQEATRQAELMKEVLYQTAKISLDDTKHSTEIPQKGVQICVIETPVTTGYMSQALFSGEHFPCDLDLMEQYGAYIVIYNSQLKLKFEKLHYPIFKTIFEKRFASKYSKSLLLNATRNHIILYELCRQLHKFHGARERLKELYGVIDEANAGVSAIEHSKYLLVKGVITQDELEAIIVIQLCWMLSDWISYQTDEGMESYAKAEALVLTYYLLNGALSLQDGISWPNFPKIFFETEELASILGTILQHGGYYEAEKLINMLANMQNFKKLSKNLNGVHLQTL